MGARDSNQRTSWKRRLIMGLAEFQEARVDQPAAPAKTSLISASAGQCSKETALGEDLLSQQRHG